MADPHVEIRVDPGRGKNSGGDGNFAGGGNGLGGGQRTEILVTLDASVKLTEEGASVPRVVFPGIFPIEEKTDGERLIALHGFAGMAHSIVEIAAGGFCVHPLIAQTTKTTHVVTAKHSSTA